MSTDEVRSEYFMWLSSLVSGGEHLILLKELYNTEFYSLVDRDYNLETKAKGLRYEFSQQLFYQEGPATVLEVLIQLAIEMDYILWNPDFGDRTVEWFWEMMDNLGLSDMPDDRFFERGGTERVNKVIHRFLDRQYTRSGRGNIFTTSDKHNDFRHTEIWYQLNEYVKENFDLEGNRRIS